MRYYIFSAAILIVLKTEVLLDADGFFQKHLVRIRSISSPYIRDSKVRNITDEICSVLSNLNLILKINLVLFDNKISFLFALAT